MMKSKGLDFEKPPASSWSAFIPAAGLGERLRPITDHIPKPILPILGKPIIERIIEKLLSMSIGKIGINLHYKADMMRDWAKKSAFSNQIELFYEDPILGTGGALKNAETFLKKGPFLVHNSDILSDIDLMMAIESHQKSDSIATLIVHDYREFNRLIVDDEGLLIGLDSGNNIRHRTYHRYKAFTGIAIYEPEFLDLLPHGRSSVIDAWIKAINEGHKISTIDVTGSYWTDIGKPSTYARAVFDALKKSGENLFIKEGADCASINMRGFVSIEGECSFRKGVSLSNCILIGRKDLGAGDYENSIIGPDFEIRFNMWEKNFKDMLIATGGSDRRYFRSTSSSQTKTTVIVVKYPAGDPDFERHIEYTRFFLRHKIPVPELIKLDPRDRTAIFEDLGDASLYNWLKCNKDKGQIEMMYQRVLDVAVSLHSDLIDNISECPLLQERVFDHGYFRWETDYFLDRFVKFDRTSYRDHSLLNELDRLARRSDSYEKRIIHRDFQSQNIMIRNGIPHIIDYQGARIGPPAYDIASILWDPYYKLDDSIRERLLQYYISRMLDTSKGLDSRAFLESLIYCRLQRHMQVLGAYGFLSEVKGKRYFIKFIPDALEMLKKEIKLVREEYPSLFELISSLSSSNYEMFSL